jgi:hypothetical protein
MAIYIDDSLFLISSFLFLLLLPHFHLILMFFIMAFAEWFDKLFQKIIKLLTDIYDIILYILQNPIILIGLIIYLCMSIA